MTAMACRPAKHGHIVAIQDKEPPPIMRTETVVADAIWITHPQPLIQNLQMQHRSEQHLVSDDQVYIG